MKSTPLRAIQRVTLERALAAAGFSSVDVYGSYAMTSLDSPDAADLVVVAKK